MNYKLRNPENMNIKNISSTILANRGIKDVKTYLNLTDEVLYSYELLGESLHRAVKSLLNHISKGDLIQIIVDPDADGYCSASMLFMYLRDTLHYDNVVCSLHSGKIHGIGNDIVIEKGVKLLIVPDAGTNDVEQAKGLTENGIDVIVLDHHISDKPNPYAIIVNNQTSDYPNKHLSGAGIVYKFLQALDDETWNDDANNYLDLLAVANIGDIMDLREYETRRLVTKGLQNIQNPLLKSLINKRKFDVSDEELPTVNDIAFYITPLINAVIRSGTAEEKLMMFEAFTKTFKEFDYKPRRKSKDDPVPPMIKESIYDRATRLSLNARSRQNKLKEKSVQQIIEKCGESNQSNIIYFANATNLVEDTHGGLVAMDIAKKHNRPCLTLKKTSREGIYAGSGRNVNDGAIEDLKAELEESGYFEMVAGHSNAFGCEIKKENIPKAIEYFNNKFYGYDFKPIYYVDLVVEELTYQIIRDIDKLKWVYSSFVEEPKIVIENLEVGMDDVEVFGTPPKRHWKINLGNVEYIKFNIPATDELINLECDCAVLNLVGTAKINKYGGKATPQFLVQDYEIIDRI